MDDKHPTTFIGTLPVPGIDPVDGWHLYSFEEWDSDGFRTPGYTARLGTEERLLHTCRFGFTPSQDRFAFLVKSGFPVRPGKILGPWDDTDIEAALAERRAA